MNEQTEFKFPDEINLPRDENGDVNGNVAEPEFKIEIEDDTPEQDRGRTPLPKKVVDELDNDDLEEYSEKVKKRLGQMKKVWHDERRAKEAALREREEALRFAQTREQEVRQLRQRLGVGEKAYISEVTKAATNDLTVAKDKLKAAYESGDADLITAAQEALTDAKLRIKEVERFKPSLQEREEGVKESQQVQAPTYTAPKPDDKAVAWQQKNTWFGADEEMTALALGLHEKLVRAGVNPSSDTYYAKIDETMRKRFPENFEEEAEQTTEASPREEKPRAQKAANVVAPVTRTTAPRQTVRLTPTQIAIAKKLGLSNEQYARELMKLEAN
jgi:hypothetical protein